MLSVSNVALYQLSVSSVVRGVTPVMLEALCDITIEPRDKHMMSNIINDHGTFLTSPKSERRLLGLKRLITSSGMTRWPLAQRVYTHTCV